MFKETPEEFAERTRRRLHVVDGILWAMDNAEELLRVSQKSPTREAAVATLTERHGLDEFQAHHVMDLRFAALNEDVVARYRDEKERLLRGEDTSGGGRT